MNGASETLEEQLKRVQAEAAIAAAEKEAAESRKAKAIADAAAASAEADARRATEAADAEHRKALAEAEQAETEARKAADAAQRALDGAEAKSRLDSMTAEAEARKTAAEADAAAVKVLVPDPSLKPLEGTVTADASSGVIADTVAYSLLDAAGKDIADKIRERLPRTGLDAVPELIPLQTKAQQELAEASAAVKEASQADEAAHSAETSTHLKVARAIAEKARSALQPLDRAVAANACPRILVLDDRDLAISDWRYQSIRQQVRRLGHDLDSLASRIKDHVMPPSASEGGEEAAGFATTAAVAALGALPKVIGAGADIVGYFQSNYGITGRQVAPKAEPLLASVVGALASHENGVHVVVDGFHRLPDTKLLQEYNDTLAKRWLVFERRLDLMGILSKSSADLHITEIELEESKQALAKAKGAKPPNEDEVTQAQAVVDSASAAMTEAETLKNQAQSLVDAVKAVEDRVDAFVLAVNTPPSADSYSPLAQAVLREALHPDRDLPFTHILFISLASLGGEVQKRERRFLAPVLRYVGTCTYSVLLAKVDGQIDYAGSTSLVGQLTFKLTDGAISHLSVVKLS